MFHGVNCRAEETLRDANFIVLKLRAVLDLEIVYTRHVKHAARGPHAALCKHNCGPHKGYCNLVI